MSLPAPDDRQHTAPPPPPPPPSAVQPPYPQPQPQPHPHQHPPPPPQHPQLPQVHYGQQPTPYYQPYPVGMPHAAGAGPGPGPGPGPGHGVVPGVAPPTGPPPRPLSPLSTVHNGRLYSLEIAQQPVRARMCGFGDKDRRPLTPPPCVRLVVRDPTTGQELDTSDVDTSFLVLTVDLWDHFGSREVNMVRHSPTAPSISTASSAPYPSSAAGPHQPQPEQSPYGVHPPYHAQGQPAVSYPVHPPYTPPQQSYYMSQYHQPHQQPQPQQYYAPALPLQQQTQGSLTRNLIGSVCASAFRLSDPHNRLGIWFILQDLSVRTEGSFRLKMNLVDVGVQPPQSGSPATADNGGNGTASDRKVSTTPGPRDTEESEHEEVQNPVTVLNKGSAPVLATALSDVFEVFSAKKFPGVFDSTPLSKCFAVQGIKIPIRKDGLKSSRGPGGRRAADGDEWDE